MNRNSNKKQIAAVKQQPDANRRVQTEICDTEDHFDIDKAMKKYKFNFYDYGPAAQSFAKKASTRKSNGTSVDKTKKTTTASFANALNRNYNYNKSFTGHNEVEAAKKVIEKGKMTLEKQNKIQSQSTTAANTILNQKRDQPLVQENKQKVTQQEPPQQAKNLNYYLINDKPETHSKIMQNPLVSYTNQSTSHTTISQEVDYSKCTYINEKVIGSGTFGVVYKARVKETGEIVAIKKVLQDKRYKNRELQILKELDHPNVLKLKHAYFSQGENPDETYLHVVMNYYPDTVFSLNRAYLKNKQLIPNFLIKLYSYQILRSIAYIHAIGICHRDIKPHNILVDQDQNKVVLCDFGSAKKLIKGEPNISYICSRCYRAPELIFGATDYNTQIDVWSTGCVIAEMLNGDPLFIGESAVDQLVEIIKVVGTPTKEQVLKMNSEYNMKEYKFPQIKAREWKKVFRPKTEPLCIDLISKILVYSPVERLTPLQALAHPYFDELRDEAKLQQVSQKIHVPNLFDYTEVELQQQPELAQKLIPEWYRNQ